MRDAAINLRATPEKRDLIDRAATLQGKSRTEFILAAACERASDVVLDQAFFNVNADRFQQLTALLDAPGAPNAGMQRLMAMRAPWGASAT